MIMPDYHKALSFTESGVKALYHRERRQLDAWIFRNLPTSMLGQVSHTNWHLWVDPKVPDIRLEALLHPSTQQLLGLVAIYSKRLIGRTYLVLIAEGMDINSLSAGVIPYSAAMSSVQDTYTKGRFINYPKDKLTVFYKGSVPSERPISLISPDAVILAC